MGTVESTRENLSVNRNGRTRTAVIKSSMTPRDASTLVPFRQVSYTPEIIYSVQDENERDEGLREQITT